MAAGRSSVSYGPCPTPWASYPIAGLDTQATVGRMVCCLNRCAGCSSKGAGGGVSERVGIMS